MHRIDTPNRAIDLWGAGKPGWRDGNKALGVNPTEFNALFMNGLQEELANLIETAGIALDVNNNMQLLAALRAAGVFQTPAQFDSSTKAATTAFVQAIGLQAGGFIILPAGASVLTSASVGKSFILNGTNTASITLPAANSSPAGTRLQFTNQSSGSLTLNRAGTDIISYTGAVNGNSAILGAGDTLTLESAGAGAWIGVAGSVQLAAAAVFASSIGTTGYQKLPSGLIVQWGNNASIGTSSGNWNATFPVAFSTSCYSASILGNGGNTVFSVTSIGSSTTALSATAMIASSGAITGGLGGYYFAIGK